MHILTRSLVVVGVTAFSAISSRAQSDHDGFSWPQWRGPDRDGVSLETEWLPEGRPEPLWTAEVGLGYSSFSIANGRLYTMGFDNEVALDVIWCLDAKSGEILWDYAYGAKATPSAAYDEGHRGGTNSTPSVVDGAVYVLNREGSLYCFDAVEGDIRWHQNYVEELELEIPTWGFAASPLVLDDVVIVNVGQVLALDKKTGAVRWRSEKLGHAYSTPTDFEFAGTPALAVFNSNGLAVLDRTDGSTIAVREWSTPYDINAASPIVIGDRIYVSSGQQRGNAMLRLTKGGLETVWENKHMGNKMSGCVLIGGHLYGFHEMVLRCISLDGEVRWSHRGLGYGALMGADGKLIILDDTGNLLVARATPEGFELLSQAKVLDGGVYWTRPVLVDGRIYCRNNLGDLVCRDHRLAPK